MLTQDGGQFGIIATECIHYFSYCSDKITSQRRLILAHTLAGYSPSWWEGVVIGCEVPSWWGGVVTGSEAFGHCVFSYEGGGCWCAPGFLLPLFLFRLDPSVWEGANHTQA